MLTDFHKIHSVLKKRNYLWEVNYVSMRTANETVKCLKYRTMKETDKPLEKKIWWIALWLA